MSHIKMIDADDEATKAEDGMDKDRKRWE